MSAGKRQGKPVIGKVITFGPFRGRRVTSLPEDYLLELVQRKHIDPLWINAAQDELVRRSFSRAKGTFR